MKIIIMGPPGVGKGTQAKLLAEHLGLKHISTGDLLREEVRRGGELGKSVKEYMNRGELVPDDLIIEMLKGRLDKNFILDGFPRTRGQAEALAEVTAVDHVLDIQLSAEEIVRRLSARRVCEQCGRNYNLLTSPPEVEGICDVCGGRLIQRDDDRPEVIRRRYQVYQEETAPVEEFYRKLGVLAEIDGARPIEEVFEDALTHLAR